MLIKARPGAEGRVAAELRTLAAGRLDVEPADHELRVLEATAKPLGQSTALFAAIGAMVGLLFAANAMLLTLPDRRRSVAELYTLGSEPRQIELILLFQALVLGVLASGVGLVLGDLLAHTIFHQSPVYLAAAFPINTQETVHLGIVLLAFLGGVLAALSPRCRRCFSCSQGVLRLRAPRVSNRAPSASACAPRVGSGLSAWC